MANRHAEDALFNDLIPELRQWNGGKGVDAESWISMVGKYDLAIGYSLIFWPRFVAFDGYVLRDGSLKRAFEDLKKRRKETSPLWKRS